MLLPDPPLTQIPQVPEAPWYQTECSHAEKSCEHLSIDLDPQTFTRMLAATVLDPIA